MFKRNLFIIAVIISAIVFTADAFGQAKKSKRAKRIVQFETTDWDMTMRKRRTNNRTSSRRKKVRNFALPEKDDEVLVMFRKKQTRRKAAKRR